MAYFPYNDGVCVGTLPSRFPVENAPIFVSRIMANIVTI
mgnify:CR=1 FL=1